MVNRTISRPSLAVPTMVTNVRAGERAREEQMMCFGDRKGGRMDFMLIGAITNIIGPFLAAGVAANGLETGAEVIISSDIIFIILLFK